MSITSVVTVPFRDTHGAARFACLVLVLAAIAVLAAPAGIVALVAAAGALRVFVRSMRARVELSATGVAVHGRWRTTHFDWARVDGFHLKRIDRRIVVLRLRLCAPDARSVPVHVIKHYRQREGLERVAAALNDGCERLRARAGRPAPGRA